MGNKQRKNRETEPWELDEISELTGIPFRQLENIYKDFRRVSKNYLLDNTEFRFIYQDMVRNSPDASEYDELSEYEAIQRQNAVADRIFRIFNKDKKGRLTFEDFIGAYIMLQNSITPERRLNYLLDRYSENRGYVTPNMGRRVIQDMSELYGVNVDDQQIWRNLETNYGTRNGYVPQQAFTNYFLNDPTYSSAFYKDLKAPIQSQSPRM